MAVQVPSTPTFGSPRSRRRKLISKIGGEILWHGTMLIVCAFVLIPIVLVVLGSFKTVAEFFSNPYGLPESFDFFNYTRAWDEAEIQTTMRNSLVSTVIGVLVSTLLACLASYGLARFSFPGRIPLRLMFVGGLVVPVQLIILPLFIMFRQWGLLGSLWSLIVLYSVFGIPLGVLVLTGFFGVLPRDLEDAARIDGASHFQIFWRIMLPLTRPAIAAVMILNGVWMWNDFFLGFILIRDPDNMTLPLGIMNFRGTYVTEWGLIFASVTISIIPVVGAYLLLSRQFIAGLTAGSVKG
jgi:raffinose/stachyose/melibiose transport system permease protein